MVVWILIIIFTDSCNLLQSDDTLCTVSTSARFSMIFRQQCQSGFLYHFEKYYVLWKSNVYRLTEWRHLTDVRRNRERTSIFTVQCVWVRAVVDMVTDMLCTRTFWVRTQLPDIAYNTCFNITLFSWCRSVCCGIRAPCRCRSTLVSEFALSQCFIVIWAIFRVCLLHPKFLSSGPDELSSFVARPNLSFQLNYL